jgi:predicted nucleic acid-binding protein
MLLDSNIIIYATQPGNESLRRLATQDSPSVSIITYVEVLGYHRLTVVERQLFQEVFSLTNILPLTNAIAEKAIELRQERRISLGDFLIAATALVNELTLVTRNIDDFHWIPSLKLLSPPMNLSTSIGE